MSMSDFANTIFHQKYSHTLPDGSKETWEQVAHRVATNVMGAVNAPESLVKDIERMIADRKFMPGGRYLYAAGRGLPQCNNCSLYKAEDSREGWADLLYKICMALTSGAGVGVVYSAIRPEGSPISRTGGTATGPLALMQMVNECGRHIQQGGSRRSAIWAGLHWNHSDALKFISLKNWSPEIRAMKEKDYNFPATLDGTNISVILDDDFFVAIHNTQHPQYQQAHQVYWGVVRGMLKTAEPGFSVDIGENNGENLRNAPICAGTRVTTQKGEVDVLDLVGQPATIWTGQRWVEGVVFNKTNDHAPIVKVSFGGRHIRCDATHPFLVERPEQHPGLRSIDRVPAQDLKAGDTLHTSIPFPTNLWSTDTRVESVVRDGFETVYCVDVKVDEHSFMAEGVIIANCNEITSRDDSDICNLGSINMARVESVEEMSRLVELSTAFLLAGTVYSVLPHPEIEAVRTKNRRLGLGLMGLHEWLLKNGKEYGHDSELEAYLDVYTTSTDVAARYADRWGLSHPIKTRSIAPTGTISIVAETTSGIEPLFCVAYKRRYLIGQDLHYQYVIDPGAKRLIDQGVDSTTIQDAYSLAENVERRLEFQAWLQKYVDHAISSTINLPAWGSELNNESRVQGFGDMLLRYLPQLRGITCYPDGARDGQPLTPVAYEDAIAHVGEVFVEQADVCDITKGGTCGA